MSFQQNKITKEACVGNLEQAMNAQKNGADRIELCARLDLGGTTPSPELIIACHKHLTIPIKVMIRPRGGNFVYSEQEIKSMLKDIEICKSLNVAEYVLGALDSQGQIDLPTMKRLSANVNDAPITFHKAIDEVSNIEKSISDLKEIPQIKSVLTSGLANTALEGRENLKKMLEYCGDQITVIVAGKVTNENINELHNYINAREYHGKKIVGNL